MSEATARLLGNTYGMRGVDIAELAARDPALAAPLIEGRPEIMAQVDFAVNEELAATVRDVMIRRTQLFFRDFEQGLPAVDAVADRMAELLAWTDQQKQTEIAAYKEEVARSRRWRDG